MEQPGSGRPRLDVATPVFEGPLELLLALAEREEIDIFQVSLSALTDAYLAELAQLEERDPVEMADFLWLAARLIVLPAPGPSPSQTPTPSPTATASASPTPTAAPTPSTSPPASS